MKCGVGKKGFKFGKNGKCYTGKGAKEKALKQGRAIKVSQSKKKDKCVRYGLDHKGKPYTPKTYKKKSTAEKIKKDIESRNDYKLDVVEVPC